MRIAVVGTGGVGGYYGGKLARAGNDVTFVARGEHYSALASRGLSVKAVDGDFELSPVRVLDAISKLESPELVLLATKTYDRDEAAQQLRRVVNDATIVISLLNGIDNDLQMARILTNAKVYPGLAYVISTRTAPGLIEQTAGPRTIIFGERKNPENRALKAVETMMQQAGIQATFSPQIERDLWTKFLWITTFAGMTSICRTAIGPIVNDEHGFEIFVRCLDEAIAVAAAEGVKFDQSERARILEKGEQYRRVGSDAKASMLVDIESSRPTEIESLNGALVRLAKVHGVPVPIQETIYAAVRLSSAAYLARK